MTKTDTVDKKTKKYREIMDQIIVEVKDASIEDHNEPFRSWFAKNRIILEEVDGMRKNKNDTSKISAFLLESQYIEFKIIDLLQKLEILVNSDPEIVKFQGEKRFKELYELTLGQLYKELSKYNAGFLKEFIKLIKELNKIRIRFAHYLFTSIKDIEEIIKEAKRGLAHNDKVIEELLSVFEYIEKNTWYGQMYERKRVKEFSNKKKD